MVVVDDEAALHCPFLELAPPRLLHGQGAHDEYRVGLGQPAGTDGLKGLPETHVITEERALVLQGIAHPLRLVVIGLERQVGWQIHGRHAVREQLVDVHLFVDVDDVRGKTSLYGKATEVHHERPLPYRRRPQVVVLRELHIGYHSGIVCHQ